MPGSKSITNRALVCAALASGTSVLRNVLLADDTEAMLGVLAGLGVSTEVDVESGTVSVVGVSGRVPATDQELDVRQSGTTARFVLPLCALGSGTYRVTAHPQMAARPMATTFAALEELGAGVEASGAGGHLPAVLRVGSVRSARLRIPGDASSQFLSGLLLIGPCLPDGLEVALTSPLVSRPYVDLTVAVMRAFGAVVEEGRDGTWSIQPGGYRATDYAIEPDASAASYPLAAAVVCGGRVRVRGLGPGSLQGDAAFADVLGRLGATVVRDADGVEVRAERGRLHGGTVDMTHISDTAQTLAVVAPFATEPLTITGIGFIRRKETDRIAAVATELARCGVDVRVDDDGWRIGPGAPHAADIETYEDHRMAMSFALIGLAVPGIRIVDPGCVAKTFPGYWRLLEDLRTPEAPSGGN